MGEWRDPRFAELDRLIAEDDQIEQERKHRRKLAKIRVACRRGRPKGRLNRRRWGPGSRLEEALAEMRRRPREFWIRRRRQ